MGDSHSSDFFQACTSPCSEFPIAKFAKSNDPLEYVRKFYIPFISLKKKRLYSF